MKNTKTETTETKWENQKLTDKEKKEYEKVYSKTLIDGYRIGVVNKSKLKRILREKGFTKDDYIVKEIKKIDKQLKK